MGQRINIQYSIDIDDLPNAVAKLLEGALTDLTDVISSTNATGITGKQVMELNTLNEIQGLRTNLERIDHTLGDVSNLINSYISYQTTPQQTEEKSQEEPAPTVPEDYPLSPLTGQTTGTDLDKLQTQIERFREAIVDPIEGSSETAS